MSDLYEFYTGNALNIPTYIDNQDVVTRSQEFKTPQRNRHMGIRMNCLCEVFEAERFHPLKIARPTPWSSDLKRGRKYRTSTTDRGVPAKTRMGNAQLQQQAPNVVP